MEKVTRIFDLLELYRNEFSGRETAFTEKQEGQWRIYSAGDYVNLVDKLSAGILALGLKPGDKVATVMNNRPHWNFFDMALMRTGAIQVPVYPTISAERFKFIFNDAEVKYVIVSGRAIYDSIASVLNQVPSLLDVYTIDKIPGVRHWEELLEIGQAKEQKQKVEEIASGIDPDDVATIIYTSGTTGTPKGVMLTHHNFISNFFAVSDIIRTNMVSVALSFLPLCHVYERMLNYMYQNVGIEVHYVNDIDTLGESIKEVRPEIFCAVPRVIEKSFNKIIAAGRDLKGLKRRLFFWAVNLGYRYKLENKSLFYKFQLKIADRLVYSKWRKGLGGRLEVIVSGGATLQPRLARVFWAAGIKVMEGYGLTETSPVISVANFLPGGVKFGTVGKVLPGVEVKIANDNEILTRGPNLMKGYYRQPERTRKVIDEEGWFHTGDIGHLENGQYLKITDRKKEIFKTSGGKYIAPQVLENRFKLSEFIEHIMIIGENRNFAAALIIPDFEHLRSWFEVKGYTYESDEETIRDPRVIKRIAREIKQINASLDKTEQVKRFELLADNWSVAGGEFSPTLKVRRRVIHERYKHLIEEIYNAPKVSSRYQDTD
ncbi:MAG: long-chain fatty acid--CoA ligase [Bacteroidales bacterium]|nr:long-chain fatty acid--CoA ligase [Bacteroidales bacterium]